MEGVQQYQPATFSPEFESWLYPWLSCLPHRDKKDKPSTEGAL